MTRTIVARTIVARSPRVSATPGAPTILSGPTVIASTATTLTITWTFDQHCQSYLDYGTTASYGSETTHETSFDYSTHTQTISGLTEGTTYHFRVRGTNVASQTVTGSDTTGATVDEPDPTGDGYPPDQSGVTYVAPPSTPGANPSLNSPVADLAGFATQHTRIAAVGGRPRNPTNAVFTADQAYIMCTDSAYPILIQNTTNYPTVTYPWSTYGYYPGLATANAQTMWMAWSGNNFIAARGVNPSTYSVIKTFSEYSEILIDTHCCQSWDDRYWPINGKSGSTWYAFVWDRQADTKSTVLTVGANGTQPPDRIAISPSGTYVTIMENSPAGAPLQKLKIYDRATMSFQRYVNSTAVGSFPHHDYGKDANGDDCIVAVGNASVGAAGMTMWRMSDGWVTKFGIIGYDTTGHISTKAIDMGGTGAGGWAHLSETNPQAGEAGYGQIIAVKLDVAPTNGGTITPTVKSYGYCFPSQAGGSRETKATPSRDGKKVVYYGEYGQGSAGGSVWLVEAAP